MIGDPKHPADRNLRMRELARGEECTLRFPGGACDPATVVLAHPNSLEEMKGMGYKGNDSAGVFACSRCHKIIDQPGPSDPPPEVRLARWVLGLALTEMRLREIASSPTIKPWKTKTALWALARRTT